jgi:selenocysteine-specific elongation factor
MRVARHQHEGLTRAQLTTETGWRKDALDKLLADLIQQKHVLRLGERYVDVAAVEGLKRSLLSTVEDFHKQNPLVPGIGKEELREAVRATPEIFTAVVDLLAHDKKLDVTGELVRLPGRGVVMKDEEAESKKIIELAFSSAGLQVPALYNVLAGLKLDKTRAQKIVTLLLRDKILVKVSEELVFHQSALQELRRQLAAYKVKSTVAGVAKIDVGKFKELTGVSRKYAIPLLEYLDRERVTRRVGDERLIL